MCYFKAAVGFHVEFAEFFYSINIELIVDACRFVSSANIIFITQRLARCSRVVSLIKMLAIVFSCWQTFDYKKRTKSVMQLEFSASVFLLSSDCSSLSKGRLQ